MDGACNNSDSDIAYMCPEKSKNIHLKSLKSIDSFQKIKIPQNQPYMYKTLKRCASSGALYGIDNFF